MGEGGGGGAPDPLRLGQLRAADAGRDGIHAAAANATLVEITERGFQGSGDETLRWINDTVGGFTTVLCALKALLEHGIELGAVADHHPA
jgi:hypothetical protein